MPNPPLAPGTHGTIRCTYDAKKKCWRARCRYRDFDGKYYQPEKTGRTKSAAIRGLEAKIRDFIAPTTGDGVLTSESFVHEAAIVWLKWFERLCEAGEKSFTSLDNYRSTWSNQVKPALGELRIREVESGRVASMCEEIKFAQSASRARNARAVISGILEFAMRDGAVGQNVAKKSGKIETPKAERKRQKVEGKRVLTAAQLLDLIRRAEADAKAVAAELPDILRLAAATGERTGEIFGAHWPMFDADAKVLRMGGNVIHPTGRGQMLNDGKTMTAERDIALAEWTCTMLAERRWAAKNPDGPIFPSRNGTMRSPANVRRSLRAFLQRIFDETHGAVDYTWVTFRAIRKTVITLLDAGGLTARQIADIVGHAHVSMTQNVYMGRGVPSRDGAVVLENVFSIDRKKTG